MIINVLQQIYSSQKIKVKNRNWRLGASLETTAGADLKDYSSFCILRPLCDSQIIVGITCNWHQSERRFLIISERVTFLYVCQRRGIIVSAKDFRSRKVVSSFISNMSTPNDFIKLAVANDKQNYQQIRDCARRFLEKERSICQEECIASVSAALFR